MGLRCSNIACNRTIALQIDHRDPWTTNNQTVLDNQDPLCPECHNHKTHHGWNLEPGKGPRQFLPPGNAPKRSESAEANPTETHPTGSDSTKVSRGITQEHEDREGAICEARPTGPEAQRQLQF